MTVPSAKLTAVTLGVATCGRALDFTRSLASNGNSARVDISLISMDILGVVQAPGFAFTEDERLILPE